MYNKKQQNNDATVDLILILVVTKNCRRKINIYIFIYLPTFSIVSPSSSSYSCMVSWQVILLLLHNFTISLSFVSVLMLKSNFDSSCVFVLPGFLYGTTSSGSSGFGERTSWHSLRSTVFEDIGFVEIFIVSILFVLSFTCVFTIFFIFLFSDNSLTIYFFQHSSS